jgi:SAM-dependent methyltransferase
MDGRFKLFSKLRVYLRYQLDLPAELAFSETRHLDLGCGANPRNPLGAQTLVGTDFATFNRVNTPFVQFVAADLTHKLPFDSGSFTSISAFDVLEHVPRWERLPDGSIVFPFVQLMSEIHRILKPGGVFYAVTPGYPAPEAFQDPTHVNFITLGTIEYFSGSSVHARTLGYGFDGEFEVLHNSWLKGAGPFAENRLNLFKSSGFFNFASVLKFLRRFWLLLRNRRPAHILWVLKRA